MSQLTFCLVTPSYAPDFDRCQLLSRSVEKFISPNITHYIIVDKQDLPLFLKLKNSNTVIIAEEDLLPNWLVKIPRFTRKNIWFSWKTLPVRGWLLQQLIKLNIAKYVNEDILIFADSDVAFVKSFNLQNLIREDKVRLFREPKAINIEMQAHYQWYRTASKLLGLPPVDFPASNYVGNLITWRRDNVFKLYEHLEGISRREWLATLCNSWYLSEYVLYGVFVEQIMREESGHYFDSQNICHDYWLEQPMSNEQIEKFFKESELHQTAVMISAKANMPVKNYSKFVI